MPAYQLSSRRRTTTLHGTAEAAVQAAALGHVYLSPAKRQHHIDELTSKGVTEWCYGFQSVTITLKPTQEQL